MYKLEENELPKASRDDVWLYIYDHPNVRARDLEIQFVKTRNMARGTLYKYKRLLEAEGKIQAKPMKGRPPYNVYYVPKNFQKQAAALNHYRQIPRKYYDLRLPEIDWQDAPLGYYLTDVKEKILWHDKETGAMLVIKKAPPGLTDAPHVHPDANKMAYVLAGEMEPAEAMEAAQQEAIDALGL